MSTQNLGQMIDAIYAMRAKVKAATEAATALGNELKAMESTLMDAMSAAGTDAARGKTATVSVGQTVRPQIVDWDAFSAFVLRRKAVHLFERRVSSKAYTELKESLKGKDVPGISEYVQQRLYVNKV